MMIIGGWEWREVQTNATFRIKFINLQGKMANWEEKMQIYWGKIDLCEKLSKLGDKNLQNFQAINL